MKEGWGSERRRSSSDYQRHRKLSPNPRVTKRPNQCHNFDQTKTELLPKRCSRFADHLRSISRPLTSTGPAWYGTPDARPDVIGQVWGVLWGGGGGFAWRCYRVDSQNPKMELPLQPSSGQTLGTCVHFQQWLLFLSFSCLFLFILCCCFFFCLLFCSLLFEKCDPRKRWGQGQGLGGGPGLWPSTPGSHVTPVTALSFMLYKNTHTRISVYL